jgi:hypothetical protein
MTLVIRNLNPPVDLYSYPYDYSFPQECGKITVTLNDTSKRDLIIKKLIICGDNFIFFHITQSQKKKLEKLISLFMSKEILNLT